MTIFLFEVQVIILMKYLKPQRCDNMGSFLLFYPFCPTLELWRLSMFVSIVCFMPEIMAIFPCYFDSPITKMVCYQVQNISNLFWPILRRYPNYQENLSI